MKSLLVLLFLGLALSVTPSAFGATPASIGASVGASLDYRFELVQAPALQVRVHATVDGSPTGETTLVVSDHWGGVDAGGEDIADVLAISASGDTLEFTRPAAHQIVVTHPPGERVTVAYAFSANDYQTSDDHTVPRRPIVNENLFRTIGHLALLRPGNIAGETLCTARFEWTGFGDAGWQVVTSWGVGDAPRQVAASLDDITGALYEAGHFELLTRDINGYPLTVTVAGDQWAFTPDEFADLCARIVWAERAFFDDFERDFYWISMVPTGRTQTGGASIGGTGLKNCFSMSVTPNAGFRDEDVGGAELVRILAHEMFHEWNGISMRREEPEELLYWFSEGFTDFYARRLLFRSGFIDVDAYAASVNKTLELYATNPHRDKPNQIVLGAFWRDDDAQKLPYRRGDIVAMVLDASIRQESSGEMSLDDVMRALLTAARQGQLMSMEYLFDTFDEYADGATVASLRRLVEDGGMPVLPGDTFAPCLAIEAIDVYRFDVGFDLNTSMADRIVVGVREDGPAYAAGLRDGMPLTGWGVRGGDTHRECTFKVDLGGRTETISYLPRGEALEASQVIPVADETDCSSL